MRGREEDYRNFKDGGVTHNGGVDLKMEGAGVLTYLQTMETPAH